MTDVSGGVRQVGSVELVTSLGSTQRPAIDGKLLEATPA